jgi:hypothetical protein
VCSSHTGGVGPPLAAPPWCENTSELFSIPVSSCDLPSMFYFRLYTPRSTRGLYIIFSSYFVSSYFCQELISELGAPWPLQATTRAKGPRKMITKTPSGRRSRGLEDRGQETLLLKDQRKLDVSFLMICRDQHYTFWI